MQEWDQDAVCAASAKTCPFLVPTHHHLQPIIALFCPLHPYSTLSLPPSKYSLYGLTCYGGWPTYLQQDMGSVTKAMSPRHGLLSSIPTVPAVTVCFRAAFQQPALEEQAFHQHHSSRSIPAPLGTSIPPLPTGLDCTNHHQGMDRIWIAKVKGGNFLPPVCPCLLHTGPGDRLQASCVHCVQPV